MECCVGGEDWSGGLLWSADKTEELMGKRWRMYLVFFIFGPQRGLCLIAFYKLEYFSVGNIHFKITHGRTFSESGKMNQQYLLGY